MLLLTKCELYSVDQITLNYYIACVLLNNAPTSLKTKMDSQYGIRKLVLAQQYHFNSVIYRVKEQVQQAWHLPDQ